MKTYSEMIRLASFEERFRYLQLKGTVGKDTFGFDRYLNQILYHDAAWKRIRNEVIMRDDGCDLSMPDRPIAGQIFVHHIEPITKQNVLDRSPVLFDLNNLVCCSKATHDAIHFGDETLLTLMPAERRPNDTCPWKNNTNGEALWKAY